MKIKIERQGKVPVHSGSIGLFFEDLNYGLDGGLYAEMLENRNFEAKDVHGEWDHYIVDEDGGYGWEAYPGGAEVGMKIKTDRPLFAENPHYMRLTVQQGGCGVKNKAYDGIYLKSGTTYRISFYARSYDYRGKVTVGVYRDKAPLAAKSVKIKADGNWRRYSVRIKSRVDADKADFVFLQEATGSLHIDCFSMMPENAVLGIFRNDLVEMMKAMKPGFLRFPGGCVVEGNNLANRYLWKNSVGQKERRRHNWNRWAVHATDASNNFRSAYSHYGQTLGVGYYEYFLLCEYLGCKALPVVSVGIACQYMSTQFVSMDDPELETYIQEALDIVEFARGGTDTEWGKVRAEMGHPRPFGLEYLGVGNEQWETENNQFYKRFELFEKRIHDKYPDLKIIGTVGPTVGTPSHESAWKWTLENLNQNPNFVYCSDEHFYVAPEWLYQNVNRYDSYPRIGKVYAGEYAAHVPRSGCALFNSPQANCWEGALAEAAFMTGMERNADVVVMASYAPLFGRLGYTQWSPDMIWFDGKTAYATANYYVQQMFSLYSGVDSLKVTAEGEGLYASATEQDGAVYVKAVNATAEERTVEIEGDFDFGELTRVIRLQGDLKDFNSIENPFVISPRETVPSATRSEALPPHSFSVLVFRKKIA